MRMRGSGSGFVVLYVAREDRMRCDHSPRSIRQFACAALKALSSEYSVLYSRTALL